MAQSLLVGNKLILSHTHEDDEAYMITLHISELSNFDSGFPMFLDDWNNPPFETREGVYSGVTVYYFEPTTSYPNNMYVVVFGIEPYAVTIRGTSRNGKVVEEIAQDVIDKLN